MEPLAPAAPRGAATNDQSFTNTTAKKSCRSPSYLAGALSLTVALILQRFCWGFTVDDAWIVSRVASHGAETGLYAFKRSGPMTDAVTPLGFAHLVGAIGALLGQTRPLDMWQIARALGVVSYWASFFIAGAYSVRRSDQTRWYWAAPLTALALPAAAWSGAGLSTPIVGLLVIAGAVTMSEQHRAIGALLLGLACALRPELVPFVVAVVVLGFNRTELPTRHFLTALIACTAPTVSVIAIRVISFGHPLPLAATAKAADLQSGLLYAAMSMIWGGLSWLIVTRDRAWTRRWALPWCAHLCALVYAGGDWMPALRLSAPLMPWLVWVVARNLRPRWPFFVALLPAAGFPLALAVSQGHDLRQVTERRLALIDPCVPLLATSKVVAAADVGWVGLCTDATILDLGGVTEPKVARLPGGHTSKMVSPGMFSDRDVDTWVIRALDRSYQIGAPLETVIPAYMVDARLLQKNSDLGFAGVAAIPLRGTSGQYVIAKRVAPESSRMARLEPEF